MNQPGFQLMCGWHQFSCKLGTAPGNGVNMRNIAVTLQLVSDPKNTPHAFSYNNRPTMIQTIPPGGNLPNLWDICDFTIQKSKTSCFCNPVTCFCLRTENWGRETLLFRVGCSWCYVDDGVGWGGVGWGMLTFVWTCWGSWCYADDGVGWGVCGAC